MTTDRTPHTPEHWQSLLAAIDAALPHGVLPEERRLIAAAPDLLTALTAMVREHGASECYALARARAAIRRATDGAA